MKRCQTMSLGRACLLATVFAMGGGACGAGGATTTPDAAGSGGATPGSGSGGAGSGGSGGAAGSGGSVMVDAGGTGDGAVVDAGALDKFSFFVTSMAAMKKLSGSQDGFGGDLRFGKPDGLSGADEICRQIAETSMPGAGVKGWHAFLSVTKGPDGQPVNAIDRIGKGPWYDRLGRLLAANLTDLALSRPRGANAVIVNDFPNETGVPNHAPDGMQVDNHDMLTGSDTTGKLYNTDWSHTCHDWTSAVGKDGRPRVGHSWPRGTGMGGPGAGGPGGDMNNWMSSLDEAGCAAGISIVEMGPPNLAIPTVGSGGGYGGIYCFALIP